MKWENRKTRLVGQSGRMLGIVSRALLSDGEVILCSVCESRQSELVGYNCGFCASVPVASVVVMNSNSIGVGGDIRQVTGSICLDLCSDCLKNLTSDLKTTVG